MTITIISGVVFLIVSFFAYANNLINWYEFIPFAFLLFPVYCYVRNKRLVNVFFAVGTVFTGIRFYSNYLLAAHHGDMLLYPITIDQPIVKQFTGLTVVIVLYIWYAYLFYACATTVRHYTKNSNSYNELISNKKISRYINLFTMSSIVLFVYFVVTLFMYDLEAYSKYMLVFICTSTVMGCCFYAVCSDIVRQKKEEFLDEMRKENPALFDKNTVKKECTDEDAQPENVTESFPKGEDLQDVSYIDLDKEEGE